MSLLRVMLLAIPILVLLSLPAAAQSRTGELRGVWMGSGYNRDWPQIMQSLKDNGFNAIFPNLCSGGAAFYPSKVLPAAAGAPQGRDELAEAIKAARQYGIEVHLWRIDWMLDSTRPEVVKQYESEGRLMRNAKGQLVRDDPNDSLRLDWLCPSNERNRKQEKEAVLEAVRKYDLAGIQLDYMRYPSADYCYCDGCRARFQKDTGVTVEQWPADAVSGGKLAKQFELWRQGLQTSLVQEISDEAHRLRRNVRVSLAAWPEQEVARHHVLQDWPAWVDQGSLDFICFMTYTLDRKQLAAWLSPAISLINGQIPIYAGLGAFMMKSPSPLMNQIETSREVGADGFVAFAYYSGDLDQWLPRLHATVTDSDPGPLPHRGPPSKLGLAGPAIITPLSARKVKAGEKLTLDLTLGEAEAADPMSAAGAAAAASVLRRSTDSRKPLGSYDTSGGDDLFARDSQLSGRVVAESPSGETRVMLGAFSGDSLVKSTFTFAVPAGPFRVAVYGTESGPEGAARPFVLRSVLLTGVEAAQAVSPADATHAKLAGLLGGFLEQVKPEDIAGMDTTAQVSITGEGGGEWWVSAKEGKLRSGEGAAAKPNVTITCSAEDALAMSRREVQPTALLSAGRLRIAGDMVMVARLFPLLRRIGSD